MKKKKDVLMGDVFNLVVNHRTNQYSLNLKKKELKKLDISPRSLLKMRMKLIDKKRN